MSRILLSPPDITAVEEDYVLDALRSGWVAPTGPHIDAFEQEIGARVGVKAALALSSGTAALHLALLGVGAGPGTVVVVPTMTFAASANAVVYAGARPVLVDSRRSDGNVDPNLLIEAVDALRRDGEAVAAVMSVDLFGRCADYDSIVDALDERGVPLIEDAAEALGASHRGIPAGAFGRAAALSFNGNKVMTTSGGGMLLSDDVGLMQRARYLSTQARQPVAWYEHTDIGYNYRMSNVLAALGRAQLTRLDTMIERRRAIRAAYVDGLGDLPGVRFLAPDDARDEFSDNCWLTCLVINPRLNSTTPDVLIKSLDAAEIEGRHLWKPMHAQPVFADARSFTNGVSDRLFASGVTLPSGSVLSDEDVVRVVSTTRAALVGA